VGADGLGEHLLVEAPGQVGRLRLALDDGAGDAEAAGLQLLALEKLAEDLFKRFVVLALEGLVADQGERSARLLEEGHDRFRTADITRNKHEHVSFRGGVSFACGLAFAGR